MAVKQETQEDIVRGFASELVSKKILEKKQATEALKEAIISKIPFINYLVREKIVDSKKLAIAAAEYFALPAFDITCFDKSQLPEDILSLTAAIKKEYALPLLKRGRKLFVAVTDPAIGELKDIHINTGLEVEPVIVDVLQLIEVVSSLVATDESELIRDLSEEELEDLELTVAEEEEEQEISEADVEDAPIVRFVNKILLEAIKKGASDIHFEPYEKKYRVRYRIDGVLYEVAKPPLSFASRVSARIKVISKLNIAERRLPQDGRFKLNLSKTRSVDFRVSVCPTLNGEKVVIRILDPIAVNLSIENLGFSEAQQKMFKDAIDKPQGMILVTGPTGSGKTVTLYTALTSLNTTEDNISTAEDPIEIHVEGVNQVQVHDKIGLTFAACLRSFLRQDPDIIMIGEMRDLETAGIAIKAAQTGHLVLSTLHTNSSTETLARLIDMGVERFDIASSVSIIIAQRLARKLCPECKKPVEYPKASLIEEGFDENEIKKLKLFEAGGCEICNEGFKGRVGIFEVLYITKEIKQSILKGESALELNEIAEQQGTRFLRQSGLDKVREGAISLEELNRVIKE